MNYKKIKIIIDCRVLQMATVDNRSKTGVYRYISCLLDGLQVDKKIVIYILYNTIYN